MRSTTADPNAAASFSRHRMKRERPGSTAAPRATPPCFSRSPRLRRIRCTFPARRFKVVMRKQDAERWFSGAANRNHMTPQSASLNYKRMKPSPLHLEKTLSVNTDRFTAPSSNPELRHTAISPKHGYTTSAMKLRASEGLRGPVFPIKQEEVLQEIGRRIILIPTSVVTGR